MGRSRRAVTVVTFPKKRGTTPRRTTRTITRVDPRAPPAAPDDDEATSVTSVRSREEETPTPAAPLLQTPRR